MGEYKIHHHVDELFRLLGVPEKLHEGVTSNDYAEMLENSINNYSTSKVLTLSMIKKLANFSPCPEALLEKYNDLKVKNYKEVDSLVYLLAEIQNNEKVKNMLKKENTFNKSNENNYFKSPVAINGHINQKDSQTEKSHEQILSEYTLGRKHILRKKNVPQGIYKLPNWINERPYLSWDFVLQPRNDFNQSGPIGVLPLNVQESRLIDDILFCLVGIEGDYIHTEKLKMFENSRSFSIDESTNISLHQLVQQIVPLFNNYSIVIRFVEENTHYEQGLVNHALSSAIRTFLKDYYVLVTYLENQHLQHNLTIQKLWYYLQPTMATMETIATLASTLTKGNCMGGAVLSLLHDKTTMLTGCSKAQEICQALTRSAARPYFEILEKWIYKGVISDYYSEFLVEDNELIKKEDLPAEYSDAYWEKRYTLRREQIPTFLEKLANMILRTGKYLNVIRQCGKSIDCPNAKNIVYTMRESQYAEYIEPAYHFASKKLLDLLMEDADLKGRLKSVKHYFLLDAGDFIIQLMDMAEEELQKDIDDVMPSRLESLLELALRTSVVNDDKYKDDIRVEFLNYDLMTMMFKILKISPKEQEEYGNKENTLLTGLEAFAFAYEVSWPLSLVINSKALACYQLLFRHLFYCKHVENLLGRVWTLNKIAKSLPLSEYCNYTSAFALLQRMLNFVQNLDYYLTLEVIEPHWHIFYEKINQVTNVDEVLLYHKDFLDKCLIDCMLTSPKLLQILNKLMKLCIDFSNFLQGAMRQSTGECISLLGDSMLLSISENNIPKMSDFPAMLENFNQQISSFDKQFDENILTLLDVLSNINIHSDKMINILYRLDFNGFYEEVKDETKMQTQSIVDNLLLL